jgi:uncharacterized protein with PIN domain/sulfur carrier protein ThiS
MAEQTPNTSVRRAGVTARFRFHEELNDFLPRERREQEFEHRCARAATVKNAIESLGVPHTEVELIRVNGEPVPFSRLVSEGDRISVYPKRDAPILAGTPAGRPRFVADAHLGGLARMLRMLGYDTVFRNDLHDKEIRALATVEERIVLTRDRELLKCRTIAHGCFVHALKPEDQLREVVARLRLAGSAQPFTLCLHCNLPLRSVAKTDVVAQLPENAARYYDRFRTCAGCQRVFWEGSHWKRMRALLDGLIDLDSAAPEKA